MFRNGTRLLGLVSIPFKRESRSKGFLSYSYCTATNYGKWFLFPSNGKAYPKVCVSADCRLWYMDVSIPFKRESLSKADIVNNLARQNLNISFHSLQTGKPIQSAIEDEFGWIASTTLFPFPSNGKAYRKELYVLWPGRAVRFPFPSNGKAYRKFMTVVKTFRAIARKLFPFPSNGKAYRKNVIL